MTTPKAKPKPDVPLQCPSAHPELPGARLLGVVRRTDGAPARVEYLGETVPASPEVLAIAGTVAPTEIFRFSAPCAEGACQHYEGHRCTLASRITKSLPVVDQELPSCAIRPACRWFREQGPEACLRCAWVVTETADVGETTAVLRATARPPGATP